MVTRKIIFVIWVALLLESAALGRNAKFQKPDHGLVDTLHREGCRAGWLAATMRLSNIMQYELRKLQYGREVVLPDECAEKPSRDAWRETKLVITQAKASADNTAFIASLVVENTDLKRTAGNAVKDAETKVVARMGELMRANAALRKDNDKLLGDLRRAQVVPVLGIWSIIWSAAGAAVIGLLWFFRERYIFTNYHVVAKAIKFTYVKPTKPIRYVFPLATIDPKTGRGLYRCALHAECHTHNIHADRSEPIYDVIERHMVNSHKSLLFQVVTKEVAAHKTLNFWPPGYYKKSKVIDRAA